MKKRDNTITKCRKKKYFVSKSLLYMQKGYSIDDDNKEYYRVRDHYHYTGKYRGVQHSICNLRYEPPKEIPVVSHNGSKYDYHFIIKELAEEFDGQLECLAENIEKFITFSVPIKKDFVNGKTITYKINFIDSFRTDI